MATANELIRLDYAGTNALFRTRSEPHRIVKHYQPRLERARLRALFYQFLTHLKLPAAVFLQPSAAERCRNERQILLHWTSRGYRVPKVMSGSDIILPGPDEECLILEFVAGGTLRDLFANRDAAVELKFRLLRKLFSEMHQRHRDAMAVNDRMLIQYNPNLSNVLVHEDELVYIDFEVRPRFEPIPKSIAREVSSFAVAAANAMGREHLDAIASIAELQFGSSGVTSRIVADAKAQARRPWNSFGKQLGVTRLDLALALQRVQHRGPPVAQSV